MKGSGREVQRLALKVREYASESEAQDEKIPCFGHLVVWETSNGTESLAV